MPSRRLKKRFARRPNRRLRHLRSLKAGFFGSFSRAYKLYKEGRDEQEIKRYFMAQIRQQVGDLKWFPYQEDVPDLYEIAADIIIDRIEKFNEEIDSWAAMSEAIENYFKDKGFNYFDKLNNKTGQFWANKVYDNLR